MSFPCNYCHRLLFPCPETKIMYEDDARTIVHNCPVIQNRKKQNPDHLLLTETITRVSQLEKRIDVMENLINKLIPRGVL